MSAGNGADAVTLRDLSSWAFKQMKYIDSTSDRLLLLYFVHNVFLSDDNPEGTPALNVMRGRAFVPVMRRETGLSDSAVRRSIQSLQSQAYVLAHLVRGRGQNRIGLLYGEGAEELRDDLRAGVRDLPAALRRQVGSAPESTGNTVKEDNIIRFPQSG